MIIYKTTNLINGKFYIGQDSKNDPNYLGSGKLLNRSIKKYGRNNFSKEILEHCKNKKQLNEREIYWIETLQPVYNIAKGGSGGDTLSNHPELQSIKSKLKGRTSWNKGKHVPLLAGDNNPAKRPEVREKLRNFRLEHPIKMYGTENPSKRPEVRSKISKNVSESWKHRTIIKCPYCSKESINASGMSRWHNENCKYKN